MPPPMPPPKGRTGGPIRQGERAERGYTPGQSSRSSSIRLQPAAPYFPESPPAVRPSRHVSARFHRLLRTGPADHHGLAGCKRFASIYFPTTATNPTAAVRGGGRLTGRLRRKLR